MKNIIKDKKRKEKREKRKEKREKRKAFQRILNDDANSEIENKKISIIKNKILLGELKLW
jgi:hypothetical protein